HALYTSAWGQHYRHDGRLNACYGERHFDVQPFLDRHQGPAHRRRPTGNGHREPDEHEFEASGLFPDQHGASMSHPHVSGYARNRNQAGFSLLELMIAMSVFLVIGGMAMTLFRQNTNLYTDQQGTTALNVTLRNSLTQIQNDVVNAANGYYSTGIATAGWSL